jgi:hypothetical protein
MPNHPVTLPPYVYLVALKDAHGTEETIGGFAEVSSLPRKLQGLHKTTDVTLNEAL